MAATQPAELGGLGASYSLAGVATNTSTVLARLVNCGLQHVPCTISLIWN